MRLLVLAAVFCLAGCASRDRGAGPRSDPAYQRGEADAVKRLYWARQALEEAGARPAGRIMYYMWEESGTTRDGRRLAPEEMGVPVFIPEPVASAGGPP